MAKKCIFKIILGTDNYLDPWFIVMETILKGLRSIPYRNCLRAMNTLLLKPIFHCATKLFVLGTGVGGVSQFRVSCTDMLVSKNAKTPDAKPKICFT